MRRFVFCALASALVTSAAVAAPKAPTPASTPASTQALSKGLQTVIAPVALAASAQPAAAAPKGTDHDQGDDNASGTARSKVCTHDNPSAQRSAICTHPISPD